MNAAKKAFAFLLALIMALALAVSAYAVEASFEYKLILTDQNGNPVRNPRSLNMGDTLNVEIELTRTDSRDVSFVTYGFEFRIQSLGLQYNGDGVSFQSATPVTDQRFANGRSVGFAYYDLNRKGVTISNPVQAGSWSYTVIDPSLVNITVPVGVLYVTEDDQPHEPVGNATLFLDPNGGKIVGKDVSGDYKSGTKVTLPDAVFADYTFLGWSDGERLYQPGDSYKVTGVVTLTAQWEGLVRDLQVLFEPNGGEFTGEDPSGLYANGETLIMPEITREGYRFLGWTGQEDSYQIGEEYTVTRSRIFTAQWEEYDELLEGGVPRAWYQNEDGTTNPGKVTAASLGGLALLAGLGFLILLLFWRRYILYSLKNGDILLEDKEQDGGFSVQVILYGKDEDKTEYRLDHSDLIEAGHKLRFIKGTVPVIPVEKGVYDGKLIITVAGVEKTVDRKIKVVDRELKERKNR